MNSVHSLAEPNAKRLIDVANESIENENEKVNSKFTVIIAAAKRARQLVNEKDERVNGGANPLTVAIDELNKKEVKIVREN